MNTILYCGELAQEVVAFIRDTRNKHNIQKDKLTLYIDLQTKDVELMDMQLMGWEEGIVKMGKLDKIEYALFELFEKDTFFEATTIGNYNIYLAIPNIPKSTQLSELNSEISRLESQKDKCLNKLNDEKFKSKAPKEIIEAEQKRLSDIEAKIKNLKSNSLMLTCGKEYYDLLYKLGDSEKIGWHIDYHRELNNSENQEITYQEIKSLHAKIC